MRIEKDRIELLLGFARQDERIRLIFLIRIQGAPSPAASEKTLERTGSYILDGRNR